MKINLYIKAGLIQLNILFLLLSASMVAQSGFEAKNGILDLSNYDLVNSRNASLKGEWKYCPEKLLSPEMALSNINWCLVKVPKNLKGQECGSNVLEAKGFGTYYLMVLINPELKGKRLLLKTTGIPSSSLVYINNELVGKSGTVSENEESYQPDMKIHFQEFTPVSDTLHIVVQVSNYKISKFGLYYNIELGLADNIRSSELMGVAWDFFIIGCILLMMMYHLVLFFLRKKDRSNLFFAIACFAFAYYTLSLSETFFQIMPEMGFSEALKLKRIALYISLPAMSLFFFHVLRKDFSKLMLKIIVIICSAYILANIFLKLSISDNLIVSFRFVGLIITLYILFVIIKALIKKREGALILAIGNLILLASIINDFLYNAQVIYSTDLMPLGMLFFLFLQSYLLATRFNRSFVMNEKLTEELTYINKNLEKIVEERTEEITFQKKQIEEKNEELHQLLEEVSSQRDEIEAQRDLVTEQKEHIEEIHKEVSQSIDYATRLQSAILPDKNILKDNISDFFVMFHPRDKVSGDFYWWANIEGHTIITAVDCTGHGVPGAFMSMLGVSYLREIVLKEYVTHPGVILRKMRKEIIRSLKQKGVSGEQKDGMDMALVSISHADNKMLFAGANNPLYFIRNGVLTEYKPDKMPIAIYEKMDNYTVHEITVEKGDMFYLFSDGLADQFGGPNGKKFMYKQFKEILTANSHLPMEEQKQALSDAFESWKGYHEQIDDVVVIGIRI
ncbi:MAG: hypothetical protein A2W91_08000 [Bacteroidetes bacterium GWF2_38_335]|nr:MAG: hypothetical protein A2W91_08000 [Bacteroidetes bacterium GWF2_38_335]OFY79008.1 MAG: hypothetical protein A2281_02720 [Bacteroidetes bacterium RIFOXYA12_FULL_38_20]HBS86085.1 hypothetical protein [Bacteroidales bacterium]